MGGLTPIAFDIETSGLEPSATLTVAGLATDMGAWLGLNTTGREADASRLETAVEHESGSNIRVSTHSDERSLLTALGEFAHKRIDGDRHYLTAYHGETWKGGFDLPFLRRACVRREVDWPFPDVAYADVMTVYERFDTGDVNNLEGVYDELVGGEHCDPFAESESAVTAHENEAWEQLLLHNLADIERTRELAVLAGRYVAKSDFKMKSLTPPDA
ncbi:hypothetical protein [Natronorubrum sp. DTA7]|uniref:hypothetical protein n=1 Tax=Natronorubrum sp. DTA7 TaxID=3447016 RepID=UPI003F87A5C2